MNDLEKIARAMATAEGLDPDQPMLPRWSSSAFPLVEWRVGWFAPTAEQVCPAWRLYSMLAQAALDAMPAAPLLLTERADG